MAVAVSGSFTVMGVAIGLLFFGPYQIGWAVVAILLSALTWWLASIFGELDWLPVHAFANHLNAYAAGFAAIAGLLTVDHGGHKVLDLFQPQPAPHASPSPMPSPAPTAKAGS